MSKTKAELLEGIEKKVISSKKIANNTLRIQYKDGTEAIRLHNTDVVTFLENGNIKLDSGGWRSSTTKDRIGQFSPSRLCQNKGVWYIRDGSCFYDGMTIDKEGNLVGKKKEVNLDKIDKMKKKITKFVNQLTKDNLPIPNNGDCWYCCLHTKEGTSMGDISKKNDHIHQHLKENYLHGSLLVNAMRESGYSDQGIGLYYSMKGVDTFKRSLRKYLQKRLIPNIAVK